MFNGTGDETVKTVSASDLDRMVAESLKDVEIDENELGGDDELDEDLLKELSEIIAPNEQPHIPAVERPQIILPTTDSVPDWLKERIEMYKLAAQNAEATNDTSKSRRIARGLKTLESMLNDALAGKSVNKDEIPLEVTTGSKTPTSPDANAAPNAPFPSDNK